MINDITVISGIPKNDYSYFIIVITDGFYTNSTVNYSINKFIKPYDHDEFLKYEAKLVSIECTTLYYLENKEEFIDTIKMIYNLEN